MVDHGRVHDMVTYASLETTTTISDETENFEKPNLDAIFLMKC